MTNMFSNRFLGVGSDRWFHPKFAPLVELMLLLKVVRQQDSEVSKIKYTIHQVRGVEVNNSALCT